MQTVALLQCFSACTLHFKCMRETWVIVVSPELFELYVLIYEVLLNSPVNMLSIIFISGWRTNSIIRSVCSKA